MIKIYCVLSKTNSQRIVMDKITEKLKNDLSLNQLLFKIGIILSEKNNMNHRFVLSFATWDSYYLTGQIILE